VEIIDLRLSYVSVPLAKPFVTALRRVTSADAVRVELVERDGFRGVGEAPPTEAVTKEGAKEIEDSIVRKIAPALSGRRFDSLESALRRLHSCGAGNSAKAAVDMALYGLWMKKHPSRTEIFGSEEIEIETCITVSLGSVEDMAQDAVDAVRRGCEILKVKLGGRDGMDVERIEAVRNAAPNARLLADANQAWSEEEACSIIESIAPFGIELVEQPLHAADLNGMRRVTEASPVKILADESVFTLEDAKRVVESGAADMVNVKLMKCGGVSRAVEILKWCERNGVECMMGSMLETPLSIEAAAMAASRFEKCVKYTDLDSPLLYEKIPEDSAIRVEGGRLRVGGRRRSNPLRRDSGVRTG